MIEKFFVLGKLVNGKESGIQFESWSERRGGNRNINRGDQKLSVWNDAVDPFVPATRMFSNFPFQLKKRREMPLMLPIVSVEI